MNWWARLKKATVRPGAVNPNSEKKRRVRGLIALLLAWLFQALLQKVHFFDRYDEADADHYARTIPVPRAFSEHITIVAVTEKDYHDLFHSQSPVDSNTLLSLVDAIAGYHPRAVGVDFLTADWTAPLQESRLRAAVRIVWARDGQLGGIPEEGAPPEIAQWNGVAGYATPPPWLCFAAPVNQPDPDGVVRTYSTALLVRPPGSTTAALFPTMPYVLASAYSPAGFSCQSEPEPLVKHIRVTGDNHNIRVLPASDLLRDAKTNHRFEKYLADRIVLVGGMFGGRDQFATIAGYSSGVSTLAHSVESEISGPIREIPVWTTLLIGLVTSISLYYFFSRLRSPLDVIFSLSALIGFSFLAGWFCYHYLQLFLPIASGLFSLPIGVIFEHHVACEHAER